MNAFLNFSMTGDPSFDFFFSITASFGLLFYMASAVFTLFRGHV